MKFELLRQIKGFVYKNIVGPLRYGSGDDYDAEKFWYDRFTRYELSLKAAGNVNLTEDENLSMYTHSAKTLLELIKKCGINLSETKVLEIGCGTGFYTRLLYEQGVKQYLGLDVTDVLLPKLKEIFPGFHFIKNDITKGTPPGKFGLVLMINVIEHIINTEKFSCALRNIDNSLTEGGVFIVGAVMEKTAKHLFYVKYWNLDEILKRLPEYKLIASTPFQNGKIIVLKKTQD